MYNFVYMRSLTKKDTLVPASRIKGTTDAGSSAITISFGDVDLDRGANEMKVTPITFNSADVALEQLKSFHKAVNTNAFTVIIDEFNLESANPDESVFDDFEGTNTNVTVT